MIPAGAMVSSAALTDLVAGVLVAWRYVGEEKDFARPT
jgi:hypothetical protein